ncbi:MAG: right-handed parallel beta-helix repeat-containing protein [Parcubacteria group bacterium]|nr:right-handed parallel beta-helix repeat-containing protein [Parcubacteria group bacterium]
MRALIKKVFAQDNTLIDANVEETRIDANEIPASPAGGLRSTQDDPSTLPPLASEDFLEVAYSFDGESWTTLGGVNEGNSRTTNFEIFDLHFEHELANLQIRMRGLATIDGTPTVYLDGMRLEISYAQEPVATEDLPKVKLTDTTNFIEGEKDFTADDSPSFTITDPVLSGEEIVTLVNEGEAKVLDEGRRRPLPFGRTTHDAVESVAATPTASPLSNFGEAFLEQGQSLLQGAGEGKENAASIKGVSDRVDVQEETGEFPQFPESTPPINTKNDAEQSQNNAELDAEQRRNNIEESLEIPASPAGGLRSTQDDNQSAQDNRRTGEGESPFVDFENLLNFVTPTRVSAQETSLRNIEAEVRGPEGDAVDIAPKLLRTARNGIDTLEVTLKKPSREFKPGRYTLSLTIETSDAVIIAEKDFTWGVFAINVNKSVYTLRTTNKNTNSHEQAYIQIGVLDDHGSTICDASLELKITSPSGDIESFETDRRTTQNGTQNNAEASANDPRIDPRESASTIERSGECGPNNVVSVPDYFAHYEIPDEAGTYELTLTATTANGTRTVTDQFEVRESVPFDIERIGPTRIYPPATYSMRFKITPREDFTGEISESLPSSFSVISQSEAETKVGTVQENKQSGDGPHFGRTVPTLAAGEGTTELVWNASLEAGKTYEFSYEFDAPDVSPEFYLVGPLVLRAELTQNRTQNDAELSQGDAETELLRGSAPASESEDASALFSVRFQEARQWQIASDQATGSGAPTRLWMTGFENNVTTADVEYTANVGSPTIQTTTVRSGTYAMQVNVSATTAAFSNDFRPADGSNANYFRMYVNFTTRPNANTLLLAIRDQAPSNQASIRYDNVNNTLELWDEDGTAVDGTPEQVGSDSAAIATGIWYRIEMYVSFVTAGAGTTKLAGRLDGTTFASSTNRNWANGVMTMQGGVTTTAATANMFIDDIAINTDSTTSAANEGYPGEGKIVYLRPNGNGTSTAWTAGVGSCSAADYTCVDEATPNDATDYVNCVTTGDLEDYNLTDSGTAGINVNDSIKLLQPYVRVTGVTSTSSGYGAILGLSGTFDTATSVVLATTSWFTNDDSKPRNTTTNIAATGLVTGHTSYEKPGSTTDPWTPTDVDSAQIRLNGTDCSPDVTVSTVWVEVEYVPAEGGRLFSSGFELQSVTDGVEWSPVNSSPTINTTTFRSGAASLNATATASTRKGVNYQFAGVDGNGPFWLRAYVRAATLPNAESRFMDFRTEPDLPITRAYLTVDNTGTLKLYDDVGLIGTGGTTISVDTWYRVELKIDATGAGATDTVEAKLDGTNIATSSTRTLGSGVSEFGLGNNLGASASVSSGSLFFDDVALNKNAGTVQNGYPGAGHIVHLRPNAAGDTSEQWTSSGTENPACDAAGDANWGCVDEVTPDDVTSAVVSSTLNQIDDFNLGSSASAGIPSGATVNLASVGIRFNNSAATFSSAKLRLKDAASAVPIESYYIDDTTNSTYFTNNESVPRNYMLTAFQRPNLATAWTTTDLDAAQIGIRLGNDGGTNNFAVTTMWMLVDYSATDISVSGRIFTDEGTTGLDCTTSRTVALRVGGGGAFTTECSNSPSNGSYSFSDVAVSGSSVITVFIDGETELANTVTRAAATPANITDLHLYQNRLIVRHDDSGPITVTNLTGYDNDNDTDVVFTANTTNFECPLDTYGDNIVNFSGLCVENGIELHVWTGDTFTPGDEVMTDVSTSPTGADGDLHIVGTLSMGTFALSVGGDFTNDGTFSKSTGQTTTLTGTGANYAVKSNSSAFDNLEIDNGLVGYWKLDEGTGGADTTTADVSGDGNTGTMKNIASGDWTTAINSATNYGNNPGGITTDTNNYVNVGDAASLDVKSFTFMAWAKIDTFSGNDFIVERGVSGSTANFYLWHQPAPGGVCGGTTAQWVYGFHDDAAFRDHCYAEDPTPSGSWRHFAVTFDDVATTNNIILYINSTAVDTETENNASPSEAGAMVLNWATDKAAGVFWPGMMDDMRLYKRALSATEISDIYNGNHPTVGSYLLSDALTVDGNLGVRTGKLDVSGTNYGVNVKGNYTNVANFAGQGGTVTFNGTASGKTIQSDPAFNDLTVSGSGGVWTLNLQRLLVNDDVAISNGTFSVSTAGCWAGASCAVNVGGDWTKTGGTFTEGTGTVTFNSTASATLNSGCADFDACASDNFYNLTINKTAVGDADDNVTLSTTHLNVANTLTITDGELVQGALNVRAEGSSAVSVAAAGKWNNISTGDLKLGGTFANAGTVIFNSSGGSCGDVKDILIRSTVAATQRNWSGAGTFDMQDLDVQDMTSTPTITVTNATFSNVGANWTTASCGFSVAGTFYPEAETGNEPGQCDGSTPNLSLRVNGGTATTVFCTDVTGAFTFTGISATAGQTIAIYSTGANKANRVYVSDATADTGQDLYHNTVAVGDEQDGNVTIVDLIAYDNDQNVTDMLFDAEDAAPDTLIVEDGVELHINTTDTFTPGGTVTTDPSASASAKDGDLHIDGTGVLTMGTNALSVGGDYNNEGTFNFTAPETTTFTATAASHLITDGGENFDDVTFNGASGGWSVADATTIEGQLTMTAGTLSETSDTITVWEDVIGTAGLINMTSTSTLNQRVDAAENFGPTTANTDWNFGNLTFSNRGSTGRTITAQSCSDCDVTITGNLIVSPVTTDTVATTLAAGDKTWTFSNTDGAKPFNLDDRTPDGGILTANTSTFSFTGNKSAANVTIENTTYYNVNFGGASPETYDLANAITASNNLTINANGTLDTVSGSNFGITIGGSYANNGTFTAQSGTVTFNATSGSKTLSGRLNNSVTSSAFNKVNFNGSGGGWTIQDAMLVSAADATDTLQVTAGTVTLGNGGGDNLDVRGKFTVAASATFQTMTTLAQGDATDCNSDDICIDVNANASTPNCANCIVSVSGNFKIGKNILVRLNPRTAVTASDTGIEVEATGYLEILGTQDDTDDDTGTAGIDSKSYNEGGSQITISDNQAVNWTLNEQQNKHVRITNTTSLAFGKVYSIVSSAADPESFVITDPNPIQDNTAGKTITGSGPTRTITTAESLITANDQSIGQYVYNITDNTYLKIVDSTNSGATDQLVVIAEPSAFPADLTGDTIKIDDGIRENDEYEILDYAQAASSGGTACNVANLGTETAAAYIYGKAGSETLLRNARICDMGRDLSTLYGVSFYSVDGSVASQGVTVDKSRIDSGYRGIHLNGSNNNNAANSKGITSNSLDGNAFRTISLSDSDSNLVQYNNSFNGTDRGIILLTNSDHNTIDANVTYGNGSNGIDVEATSRNNIISNNISYNNTSNGIFLFDNPNSLIVGNTLFGNRSRGISLSTNSHGVSIINNLAYKNDSRGISSFSSNNTVMLGNTSYSNASSGILLDTANNSISASNAVYLNSNGIQFATAASTGTISVNDTLGVLGANATADINFDAFAHTIQLYGTTMASTTEVTGATTAGASVASFKHDGTAGSTKIWNDYTIPDNNTETPQDEGTNKFNYADNLWEDSISDPSYSGTGTKDTDLTLNFSAAMAGANTAYAYRITCRNDAVTDCDGAGASWDVFRDGVDIDNAIKGTQYEDTTTKVRFTIGGGTDAAGTAYATGDTYTLVAWKKSSDTNNQKTIDMMQTGDIFTAGTGETVQLKGTSTANQTLIRKDSGATSYAFTVSGTIDANYYKFTGLDATGLNLASGATITNLNSGTFDDSGGAGASDTFITVVESVVDAKGTTTFTGMIFDDTNGNAEKNVTIASVAACTTTWTFQSNGAFGGAVNGEANDSDNGEAVCGGNGKILWTGEITVSGRIFTNEGTTGLDCTTTRTVALRVNGSGSYTAECSNSPSDGSYSIAGVGISAAGNVVTVFIDGESEKANTVTRAADTTTNITSLDLYQNRLIARHEDAGPISNANLGQYDNDNDSADMLFTSNSNNLTVEDGIELHIWDGKTLTPGGTITTDPSSSAAGLDGDLHIDGTGVLTMSTNALSVGGDFNNEGTFNQTAPQTTTFTATAASHLITDGGENFDDVTFNGASGGWSVADATTIGGILTMTAGTLSETSDTITVNENAVGTAGVINMTSTSTFEQRVGANQNFGPTTANTDWTFNNLTFSRSAGTPTITAQSCSDCDVTITGNLLVSKTGDLAATTLAAGDKTWTLSNADGANPFNLDEASGVLTANTSTFAFTGDKNDPGNVTIENTTYYNVNFGGSVAETYDLENAITASNNLTINANGTLDTVSGSNYGITVGGNWTNNGAFKSQAGTVTFNADAAGPATLSGTLSGTNGKFYNVLFDDPSGSDATWLIDGTMVVDSGATPESDAFVINDGTVTIGNGDADSLEVIGRIVIADTAGETGTLRTAPSLAQGSQVILDLNNTTTPISCAQCVIQIGATSGGTAKLTVNKNGLVRLNPRTAATASDTGIEVEATGYLEILGSQDLTATASTATTNLANRETHICANTVYTVDQHNGKYVRATSGLAIGMVYTITDTLVDDSTNCATGTHDSIVRDDNSSATEASPTVSGSGPTRILTLTTQDGIIVANNDHIGRYVHNLVDDEYYKIVDSAQVGVGTDTITIIGEPNAFTNMDTNDDIEVTDGFKATDSFEILDYALVSGQTRSSQTDTCDDDNSATATAVAYIFGKNDSETLIRYADICDLGYNTSNKYGIFGQIGVNGSDASEGFTVDKSRIHHGYKGMQYSGDNSNTANSEGFTNNSFDNNVSTGLILDNTSNNNTVTGNRSYSNGAAGIQVSASSNHNTVSSNYAYLNTSHGMNISGGVNNTYSSNVVYNNGTSANGITLSTSANSNVISSNTAFGNRAHGISLGTSSNNIINSNNTYANDSNGISFITTSNNNVLSSNTSYSNTSHGIRISASSNNVLHSNNFYANSSRGFTLEGGGSAATGNISVSDTLGGAGGNANTSSDINFDAGAHNIRLYGSTMGSTTEVGTGVTVAGAYIVSFKHDTTGGSTKVWGEYTIPDNNTETPQDEGTNKFNYADNLWEDSMSDPGYSGTGTQDTDLTLNFSAAMAGANSVYSYRLTCRDDAVTDCDGAGAAWDVFRDGVDIDNAIKGTQYEDTTTKVRFTIGGGTDAAGTAYATGDTYTLVAWKKSSDTNTQKITAVQQTDDKITVGTGETIEFRGGGTGANQESQITHTVAGSWDFDMGSGTANIQEAKVNDMDLIAGAATLTVFNTQFLGTKTVVSGTLNTDWYLSVHLVNEADTATNVDTADDSASTGDVIIEEKTATPASTIFRHDGATWGSTATSQKTGTASTGHIPQPNTTGAIRLREYAQTSGGFTYYKYNLRVEAQNTYFAYDYFVDQGSRYLSSDDNPQADTDDVIGTDWYRDTVATENAHPAAVNDPPEVGTWYAGMDTGLTFTLSATSVNLGTLTSANNFTSDASTTTSTISTSAPNGFQLTTWASQLLTRLGGSETVAMWSGTNGTPTNWNGNCPNNTECGFGYNTNDSTLGGGTADRFVAAGSCGGDLKCWAGFATTGAGDLVGDATGAVSGQATVVTYKVSASTTQAAGEYQSTILYVLTPQY